MVRVSSVDFFISKWSVGDNENNEHNVQEFFFVSEKKTFDRCLKGNAQNMLFPPNVHGFQN